MSSQPRKALIVLGCHRSGTSAMTRALSLCGAKLPRILMHPNEGNPNGYWEPLEVVDFNDRVLESLGVKWSDVFGPRRSGKRPLPLERYHDEAREILDRNYGRDGLIVLKDPRLNLLLDLWGPVLRDGGYQPYVVIMVRDPTEVATSLASRDRLTRNQSLIMWTSYMLAADQRTRGLPRVFVNFEDLLLDPEGALDRIESTLSLALPSRSWEAASEIESFLESGELHRVGAKRQPLNGALKPVETLYRYFESAAHDAPENEDIPVQTSAWLHNLEQTMAPVVSNMTRSIRAAERRAAEVDEASRELSVVNEALRADVADHARLLEDATDRLKQLEDALQASATHQAEQAGRLSTAEDRARQLAQENEERMQELEAASDATARLAGELAEANERLDEQARDQGRRAQALEAALRDAEAATSALQQAQADAQHLTEQLDQSQSERAALEQAATAATAQLEEQARAHDDRTQSLESALRDAGASADAAASTLREARSDIEHLTDQLAESQSQQAALEQTVAAVTAQLEEQARVYQEQTRRLEASATSMSAALGESRAEIQDLTDKLEAAGREAEGVKELRLQLIERSVRLEASLGELLVAKTALEASRTDTALKDQALIDAQLESKRLALELQLARSESERLLTMFENAQADLSQSRESNEAYRRQIGLSSTQIERLDREASEHAIRLSEVRADLREQVDQLRLARSRADEVAYDAAEAKRRNDLAGIARAAELAENQRLLEFAKERADTFKQRAEALQEALDKMDSAGKRPGVTGRDPRLSDGADASSSNADLFARGRTRSDAVPFPRLQPTRYALLLPWVLLRRLRTRDMVAHGDQARDRRAWSEAAQAYAEALRRDPRLAHIWVQYGHMLKEAGDWGASESAYQRALTLTPDDFDIFLNLGHLLKISGRLPEAKAAYVRALDLAPHHQGTRSEVAEVSRRLGESYPT
jgi:hypothetical protein